VFATDCCLGVSGTVDRQCLLLGLLGIGWFWPASTCLPSWADCGISSDVGLPGPSGGRRSTNQSLRTFFLGDAAAGVSQSALSHG